MYEIKCDVAIVGGGPAGLAAAVSAKEIFFCKTYQVTARYIAPVSK